MSVCIFCLFVLGYDIKRRNVFCSFSTEIFGDAPSPLSDDVEDEHLPIWAPPHRSVSAHTVFLPPRRSRGIFRNVRQIRTSRRWMNLDAPRFRSEPFGATLHNSTQHAWGGAGCLLIIYTCIRELHTVFQTS